MHTDQRRRTSAAALSDVSLVDDNNFSSFSFRQMERYRRTDYTSPEDDDIGRRGLGVRAGAGFGICIHFR